MNRRQFLASLPAARLAATAQPARLPNFIFILADDLGARDLTPDGNTFHETPALQRLAGDGVRFTNAYAACPVCSPTRASIMTGKYPARLKVTDWIAGRRQWPTARVITPPNKLQLGLEEITLAEALKTKGYSTAHVGKWHLGGQGYEPEKQGFDVNIAGDHRGAPRSFFGPFDMPNFPAGSKDDELTERLTAEACNFIAKQRKEQPFFMYFAHYTVHTPIQARAAMAERYRRKLEGKPWPDPVYAAMVESLDNSVAAVRKTLEASGLARDTVIVFFSDNGGLRYEGGGKRLVTSNAPLRAGKGHLYEGGIREPLYIHWPGVAKPGRVVDTPVSSVDFFPTLLEMAGAKPPRPVDGVSLAPLLRGGAAPARDAIYWHYPHYSNQGGAPGGAIRMGDWKLIEFYEDGRLELFNLKEDPGEAVNLVRKNAEKAREMHTKLRNWRTETNALMPDPNPNYDPATADQGLTGAEKPTPPA
jgi:arylsulfatase A-like enzyme